MSEFTVTIKSALNEENHIYPIDKYNEFRRLYRELEQRLEAGQHETIVNCPEPFTAEFLAYLLVNALRHLNEAQRHNLALSLAVKDPLFSIEEYEKQLGN